MDPDTDRLLGAISLRDLVMAELDRPLFSIMRRKPITVNVNDDQELVAQKIGKYNLLAVPVVEHDGSVVGFVTVDDVIDVLIEEQTEDLLRMAAVEPGAMDKPYFDNPIFGSFENASGGCCCCLSAARLRVPCCISLRPNWLRWLR